MRDGERPRNDLAIYDAVAGDWWGGSVPWLRVLRSMVPGRLRFFDPLVAANLGGWRGRETLDLGCAGGFMAEALARRGARVTGIDPAARAVAAAGAHAAREGLDIRYDVGVGEALPYDDASFDVVVCVDVLEHVADLAAVMAETARVLRPDGLFLFDTINRNRLARFAVVTVAENILGLLPKGTHDPEMFIRPDELRDALTGAGLTPGRFTGLGPRGVTPRGELSFGPLPLMTALYMGSARKG
ncbi:bifunctional 2-polyprenyl-6-hydroxyphenol methylase/3-demethylubiquinol 3-O-methyltransferase UbiG [Rubrimonas cliftonensis]|uniref:3-demethylubiquinone-9 3-methyltransferase n=1 Tax=Rubrimonas cliftonensis TaxID=89524 RepID=A0A1H3VG51_9RHOB|nr:bifunctional 2-polyprenyl-6-hydroxyphenol methylase/3-demethylubiquinol 3-O-methyltransferase UbiG [Rubrimonas cliftonensis]SDZ73787.1 3-demethylubiquinone-9 3-methyltransferase [Rubrimonas cliftonensis]